MAEYNKIGGDYNLNRKADTRIIDRLIELMSVPVGGLIADIGAGTGNYTNEIAKIGYQVDAVEPSNTMIQQSFKHERVRWIESSAENLELDNNSYDAVVSTLAIHHFTSLDKSLSKIHSILKEHASFVIFGADPRKIDEVCWFKEYFGDLIEKAKDSYIEVNELVSNLESVFQAKVDYIPFNIPQDITDGFFYAGWQDPENI